MSGIWGVFVVVFVMGRGGSERDDHGLGCCVVCFFYFLFSDKGVFFLSSWCILLSSSTFLSLR